jgi:DNA-damage-inducible protein J
MLSVDVRCRIDPKTKEDAAEVIESMGLTVSDAIRLFLTRVASEGAIPFELRIPNAKTTAAIAELESTKSRSKLKRHKNLDAMHDAIKRK